MLDESWGMGSWHVSPDQVDKIKAHDMPSMLQFMAENESLIHYYAIRYENKKRNSEYGYTVEDMISQLLLDLPYLKYDNAGTLKCSLYRSFYYSALGGLSWFKEHHRNKLESNSFSHKSVLPTHAVNEESGDEFCLLDLYISTPSAEEEYLASHELISEEELRVLISPWLSPRVREYFAYRLHGYGSRECLRKMGLGPTMTGYHRRMKEAIMKHYDELLEYLQAHCSSAYTEFERLGSECLAEIADRAQRDAEKRRETQRRGRAAKKGTEEYKRKIHERNTSPERRAYMLEYQRAWRARKKAKQTAAAV